MNILAIGAHPDDIEIGCGGTLIKYADQGHIIFLLILTKGERGGDGEARYNEQLQSAKIIGAKEVFWGGFNDTELQDKGNQIINRIEYYLEQINPEFIFVNYYDDTHQDHRVLNESVVSATRYIKNVLFYEVPTTNNFKPQVFVDISDTIEKKIKALEAHKSQIMKTGIKDLSIREIALSSAHFRGIQARVKYAEGFMPMRLFINV